MCIRGIKQSRICVLGVSVKQSHICVLGVSSGHVYVY
jgi:hypothetical protein